MQGYHLIQDALSVAVDAEDVAQRLSRFNGIPAPIKASVLTRVQQIEDMMRLLARELEIFDRHRGNPSATA